MFRRIFAILLCACSFSTWTARAQIVINEICPANDSVLADENGDYSDWFELYNAGADAIDLEGWGITDSPKRPFDWVLHGAILPAHGFMTIFASGKDRQPSAIPPIAPNQVSGLKFWASADGIQTNDSAQVRVANGLIFVRQWKDQSGLGNHASQATDSAQPLLVTNVLNGKSVLRFDGANDFLTLAGVLATNNFTIFAVFHTGVAHEIDPESTSGVGGVSGQHWLFGCAHGGDFNGGSGVSVGANGISAYEHGSSYMPALAVFAHPIATGFNVFALTYTNKQPSLALQGAIVRQGLTSPRAQVTSTTEIGAGYYGAFNGDLAEVIMFDRALTDLERAGVERYLASKYAIDLPTPRHTNFKLSASGETLLLSRPDGAQADRVTFGAMMPDVSYGRQPDGVGAFLYFPQPTPGASNLTAGAAELLPPVEFSRVAGFYTNGFDLTLNVPDLGAEIRYTLDGSDPTTNSTLYTGLIPIRSRFGTPNGISTIPTAGGWQPPATEVFKGWTVRARGFKNGALSAGAVTRSFFVDPKGRARYSLPVVSITTDPKNFFDPAIGIYVPGNTGANYSQRGAEWERPAHVELIETDNFSGFAKDAGVSIHGNTSQNFPIKGLDFNSNGGEGHGRFNYQIFPDRNRTSFDHFLVRPSGHDQMYTFTRDEMMQSLMHDAGMESQAARACVTFVNGEYWGLSYLKEKEDEEFVRAYGNVPADQLDFLEGYAAAKAGDTAHYDAMINFIATHSLSIQTNYEQVKAWMEVPNYIDYKAAEIFTYRWDIGNHRLWRPRTDTGRWRWLQFDNDVGWGGFWAIQPAWNFNMLEADFATDGSVNGHNTATTTFLLRNLALNDEFRTDFINRFCDLLNSVYLPTNSITRINAFAATLDSEMSEHALRWRAPGSLTEWRNNVQYLRDYANQRPAVIRSQLAQKWGLSASATVRASVANPASDRVRVSTLESSAPTNAPWSGLYFKDLPLTFTALPKPGYRFARWDGLLGVNTNSVTVQLRGDLALTAVFEPETLTLNVALDALTGQIALTGHGPAGVATALLFSNDLVTWNNWGLFTFDALGNATNSFPRPSGEARSYFKLQVAE